MRRDPSHLVGNHGRGAQRGPAGDHRAPTRKRACAVRPLPRVAFNDHDVVESDAELISDNLRESGEMALSLRTLADPGDNASVRLDFDMCAVEPRHI